MRASARRSSWPALSSAASQNRVGGRRVGRLGAQRPAGLAAVHRPFARSLGYIEIEGLTEKACILAAGEIFEGLIGERIGRAERRAPERGLRGPVPGAEDPGRGRCGTARRTDR